MRRVGAVLSLVLAAFSPTIHPNTTGYQEFSNGFVELSRALADELPFAALAGLNWADAYIGGFPHFGIGATLGASVLPFGKLDKAMGPLGIDASDALSMPGASGLPLPVALIDFRLGGFPESWDLGLKAGWLPRELKIFLPSNMTLEYVMAGGDVRFALLEEDGWVPDVSIGVGYTYYRGNILIEGITESSEEIANVEDASGTHTLTLQDPDVAIAWETNVVDLRLQVSKDLLIFVPFAGFGISHAVSKAGGGLRGDLLFDGQPITPAEAGGVESYYRSLGETVPELSSKGIVIRADSRGFAYRAFGGLAIRVSLLRINLHGMVNLSTGSLAGSVNATLQY